MKILLVSNIEWDDRNAFGNTVSNFFSGWPDTEFASIYGRSSLPNNDLCSKYYSVTIKDIVKNMLKPKKIGRQFTLSRKTYSVGRNAEKELIAKLHKSRFYAFVLFCADSLYKSKSWLNKRYGNFVTEFNPDIVFVFGLGDSFLLRNAAYIKSITSAKLVTFVADDTRKMYLHRGVLNQRRLNNLDKLIRLSDKVYGASEMLATEYTDIYKIPIKPLYKGCGFMPIVDKTHNPCEILYAGNLYYGRTEVLACLANAIAHINETSSNKYHLSIYSNSVVSNQEKESLNISGSSTLYPAISYQEVMNLMNRSTIVLHVESFLPNQIEKVRLSFSTKIIDCMQSGSVLLVIGPEGIASVEYVKGIPGAIVITDINDIERTLISVIDKADMLNARAQSIRAYSIEKHSIDNNRERLMGDFQRLLTVKD